VADDPSVELLVPEMLAHPAPRSARAATVVVHTSASAGERRNTCNAAATPHHHNDEWPGIDDVRFYLLGAGDRDVEKMRKPKEKAKKSIVLFYFIIIIYIQETGHVVAAAEEGPGGVQPVVRGLQPLG
jgi:hypothetical protein